MWCRSRTTIWNSLPPTRSGPALTRLVADIRGAKLDFVVDKVDRPSRSFHDAAPITAVFDQQGISFVWVTRSPALTNRRNRCRYRLR